MKTLLLTIIMSLSLTANAQEFEAPQPEFSEPRSGIAMLPAILLTLIHSDSTVKADVINHRDGTCTVIIDGQVFIFWCDPNEPLPEFGNE